MKGWQLGKLVNPGKARFGRIHIYLATILLVVVLVLVTGCDLVKSSAENPVDGWAVLAVKDYYDDPNEPDMPVDYIDIAVMRQALEGSGWNPDHIRELRDFNRETFQGELDWLEESADENDIVVLYVAAAFKYLRDEILWHEIFAEEWSQIPSQRRLLIVDASRAAVFTNAVTSDPLPHLSVASVGRDEFSWVGIEEEGLPIVGRVFTHYFAGALADPDADSNGDGLVSVQEAIQSAQELQRTYMHDVVLAVPEFVEMFHTMSWTVPEKDPTYPNVSVDDAVGEPLYLALDAYD
jgi:hypothetical protein